MKLQIDRIIQKDINDSSMGKIIIYSHYQLLKIKENITFYF